MDKRFHTHQNKRVIRLLSLITVKHVTLGAGRGLMDCGRGHSDFEDNVLFSVGTLMKIYQTK